MIDLSDDEREEAVAALYERLFEARRYASETERMIGNHDGHGEQCCARGQTQMWREHLEGFNERVARITGALAKMGETL